MSRKPGVRSGEIFFLIMFSGAIDWITGKRTQVESLIGRLRISVQKMVDSIDQRLRSCQGSFKASVRSGNLASGKLLRPFPESRSTQNATGQSRRTFSVVYFELAVNDYVIDPDWILIRRFERRPVNYCPGIKDSDVSEITFTKQTTVLQANIRRGQSGHLVNREFQGHQMLVADVAAKDARIGTPATGMRFRPGQGAISSTRATIGTNADERRLQRRLHVVFTHHEKDGTSLTMVGDDEIEQRIQRILVLSCSDF